MTRKFLGIILLGFGLAAPSALLGSGCSKDDDGAQSTAESPVLATVGDRTITAADFEAYLKFKRIPIRTDEQLDEQLAEFVQREVLAQAAIKGDVLDQAALQAELDEFRRQAIQSRYFETFLRTAVTREAVERYYNEHAADYETKRVRVAHILVRSKRTAGAEQMAEGRAKIEQAKAQLDAGKPFAEVAKMFSDDQVSGQRGGDMGWIREGAIDTKFSETAFGLTADRYSDPIQTPFGFHIVKVLEGPEVRKKPLSAVEGDIRHKLRAEAKAAEVARLEGLVDTKIDRGDWKPSTIIGGQKPAPAPEGDKIAAKAGPPTAAPSPLVAPVPADSGAPSAPAPGPAPTVPAPTNPPQVPDAPPPGADVDPQPAADDAAPKP